MLKKAIKISLICCFRLFSIVILFRIFVLTFGTLFSQTDDFYSYHLFGKQPLRFWIFVIIYIFILCFILCFIEAYIENHKNNKK